MDNLHEEQLFLMKGCSYQYRRPPFRWWTEQNDVKKGREREQSLDPMILCKTLPLFIVNAATPMQTVSSQTTDISRFVFR